MSRCTMYLPSATMQGDGHPAPDVQSCRAFDISAPCILPLQYYVLVQLRVSRMRFRTACPCASGHGQCERPRPGLTVGISASTFFKGAGLESTILHRLVEVKVHAPTRLPAAPVGAPFAPPLGCDKCGRVTYSGSHDAPVILLHDRRVHMHSCSGAFADPACNEHQPVDAFLPELVGQQFISACWITGSKSLLCFVIAHKSFNKGALCTAVGTSSNVRHQALRTPLANPQYVRANNHSMLRRIA